MSNQPTTVTYTIDLHMTEILTLNQRLNRYERARRTAAVRNKAVAARLQNRAPKFEKATYTSTVQFRDRRRRDGINLTPTIKAAVDGIVTGPAGVKDWPNGLLPDDDSKHLTGAEPAVALGGDLRPQWVRLTLVFTRQ